MGLQDQIDTLAARAESNDIDPADTDAILTLDRTLSLRAQDYSKHRHKKLLRHAVIMAEEVGGLADALDDRAAAERLVAWINDTYDNEETNKDYRNALRTFARLVADLPDGAHPDSTEWIPTGYSSDHDPTPDPREMLRWERDVQPMIEATYNARDAAMIALQFDAGLRGGEFKTLAVGDVQDHKHGLQVTVEGKRGRRTVTLIPSVPYVNRWVSDHSARDDPTAPLWSKLHSADGISDTMVSKALRQAATEADVTRPVTLTNFRKSSAAFLASRNLNQAHIEDHHGWVRGSDAAARYISVFAEDSDRELARLHGIDVEADEPESIAPVTCPRCREETPPERGFCIHCEQALDMESKQLLDQVTTILDDRAIEAEDAETRRSSVELRQGLDQNPAAVDKDRLHELITSLSSAD